LGIIHKDLKPSNVLIVETPGDAKGPTRSSGSERTTDPKPANNSATKHMGVHPTVRPRLCDFGIGVLADRTLLDQHHITETGFTESLLGGNDSSRTGTRLYSPPESQLGKPATTAGDVYALGVMLYQFVTGDLSRPLGTGWEEDISHELLRDDIAACTHRDPGRRLAGAADLAERLETLERRTTELQSRRRTEQTSRRLRQLRRMVVLYAIALIVVVGYGLFSYVQWQHAVAARIRAETALAERDHALRRWEAADRTSEHALQEARRATGLLHALRPRPPNAEDPKRKQPEPNENVTMWAVMTHVCIRSYPWPWAGEEFGEKLRNLTPDEMKRIRDSVEAITDRYESGELRSAAARNALSQTEQFYLGDLDKGLNRTQVRLYGEFLYMLYLSRDKRFLEVISAAEQARSRYGITVRPVVLSEGERQVEQATYFGVDTLGNMITLIDYRARAEVLPQDPKTTIGFVTSFLDERSALLQCLDTGIVPDPTDLILKRIGALDAYRKKLSGHPNLDDVREDGDGILLRLQGKKKHTLRVNKGGDVRLIQSR
jgi:serine/threonine protein kinase